MSSQSEVFCSNSNNMARSNHFSLPRLSTLKNLKFRMFFMYEENVFSPVLVKYLVLISQPKLKKVLVLMSKPKYEKVLVLIKTKYKVLIKTKTRL